MRPRFHFTAPINWINDPNGMFYRDGTYHLYYQYNPHGKDWGHMSWGHASSKDLTGWQHHPLALAEEGPFFYPTMMFSGSAVHDKDNTSGLCQSANCMVAVYTEWTLLRQTQNIAISQDGGLTFKKYQENPVLDIASMSFRDPKVFWHEESQRWIMVVALSAKKKIQFYASKNLISWTHLSDFGPQGDTSGIWECPDLLAVPDEKGLLHHVLLVSIGETPSGSAMQYFTGTFDGKVFHADRDPAQILRLDHGPDFYAAVGFYNAPAEPVIMGWANNWEYADELPTHPWRGMMSVARRLQFSPAGGGTLRQIPVVPDWTKKRNYSGVLEAQDAVIGDIPDAYQLQANLHHIAETGGITFLSAGRPYFRISCDVENQEILVERLKAGSAPVTDEFYQLGSRKAALKTEGGTLKLNILVDHGIVEVFSSQGQTVFSTLVFPSARHQELAVFSGNGKKLSYELDLSYR